VDFNLVFLNKTLGLEVGAQGPIIGAEKA